MIKVGVVGRGYSLLSIPGFGIEYLVSKVWYRMDEYFRIAHLCSLHQTLPPPSNYQKGGWVWLRETRYKLVKISKERGIYTGTSLARRNVLVLNFKALSI